MYALFNIKDLPIITCFLLPEMSTRHPKHDERWLVDGDDVSHHPKHCERGLVDGDDVSHHPSLSTGTIFQ